MTYTSVPVSLWFALPAAVRTDSARNLTFVSVPMSEYAWTVTVPRYKLPPRALFHRLYNFAVLNGSGLIEPSADPSGRLRPTSRFGEWWQQLRASTLARCKRFGAVRPPRRRSQARHAHERLRELDCCSGWYECAP